MKTVFQQFGPYEILEPIGQGMAGSVFLARDTRNGRRVALKLVVHGPERDGLEILAAERSGAELQKRLSQVSTRVPTVFEHGDHESGYYVAMEYVQGENLSSRISQGALSADEAAAIAIELCLFLEEAHRFETVVDNRVFRALVHGDLTPRNVRLTADHKLKILDFGIAKALSLSRKVTRNDFGTLGYLSPERLESGDVNEYVDFWAVGVMLYEMVSARRPFHAADTRRLEQLIVSRKAPPALNGTCPARLQAVIGKLLAPATAQRYPNARAIREDLERFRSGQETEAERQSATSGTAASRDEEETRRTRPSGDSVRPAPQPGNNDEEKTRRTAGGKGPASRESRANPRPPLLPLSVRRGIVVITLILAVALIGNEFRVKANADEIAAAVQLQELEQIGHSWDQYQDLARRDYLRVATLGLRRSLVHRSRDLAERVIANYRTPVPTVREAQWRSARDALASAAAVSPDDSQLKAALRYCEGHLLRINGEAKLKRRQSADAQADLTEAVAAFREAAVLRQGWPDPFLGLARTFIYGLQDLDRGADALRQAERNGYMPGERETSQLADGYRARGDTLTRNAKELHGLPQEREYLDRAAEAYRQALTLYLSIRDFSKVGAIIRGTQDAILRTEKRIADLSAANAEPTVPSSPQEEAR
jgi:serine/threonine protein kinase